MNWIVDTNVVSELVRRSPDGNVSSWLAQKPTSSLYISDVSLAEIRFGIEVSVSLARRNEIRVWLDTVLRPMFAGRTLEITEDILFAWRGLATSAQKSGKTLPQADSLIAATAIVQSLGVCSRDTGPYVFAGVPTLNPWSGERFNGA
jgi:hypothetical protein